MFRFVKNDIVSLTRLLGLPEVIVVPNRCVVSRLDAMCIVLRRFVNPNHLCDLESLFGMPKSSLSLIVNETVGRLWYTHYRLTSLDATTERSARVR